MTKPLTAPIFERQEDEGNTAWDAFRTYRDLGPERSLDKVAQEQDKNRSLLGEWSSTWSWVRRSAEWDRHLDRKRRAAAEAEVVRMAERQARDAMTIQDGLRPFMEALAKKAHITVEELAHLPATSLAVLVKELAPAWKAAQQQERLARGASTENVHIEGNVVMQDLRSAFLETLKEDEAHAEAGDSERADAPGDEAQAEPGATT